MASHSTEMEIQASTITHSLWIPPTCPISPPTTSASPLSTPATWAFLLLRWPRSLFPLEGFSLKPGSTRKTLSPGPCKLAPSYCSTPSSPETSFVRHALPTQMLSATSPERILLLAFVSNRHYVFFPAFAAECQCLAHNKHSINIYYLSC